MVSLLGLWPGGGSACPSLRAKDCRAVAMLRLQTSGHQSALLVVFILFSGVTL